MRKKTIITLITLIAVIGVVIITVRQNSKTIFNKTIGQVQKVMVEGMDENKPIYLKSTLLDTLFSTDDNDKILLFIPSTLSEEQSQKILKLIDENLDESNNQNLFWVLTSNKETSIEQKLSSNHFTNYINIPGLTFSSELAYENAFLFTLTKKRKISNVLWENDIKEETVKRYLKKEQF